MTEEEKNREIRRTTPLTTEEWLGFFFVPVNLSKSKGKINMFATDDFNDTEEERFKRFNFDKKLKQSYTARALGVLFYFITFIILSYFF
ncbi:hypothetical protein [uncultured Tenacibaculum sp.]|uniref:hypothetical protein n=1 Tax=uncultured Tenacibaculum sp. TaxID=174713 RepID=UPI002630F75F|nr:hypothetical protein [uncultured Tenacibaculum sp.]